MSKNRYQSVIYLKTVDETGRKRGEEDGYISAVAHVVKYAKCQINRRGVYSFFSAVQETYWHLSQVFQKKGVYTIPLSKLKSNLFLSYMFYNNFG